MTKIAKKIHTLLHYPERVLLACFLFAVISLAWNGSFYNLYMVVHAQNKLTLQIQELLAQSLEFDKKLNQARDLQFITHEAIDRYEMVGPNDLIFVFPDE